MVKHEFRRLAKGSLIYGVGSLLNRFLSFLLLPVFTRYLHPADYGMLAMLAILTMLLTGLFSLGTGNSIGVCYFQTNSRNERREIIWAASGLLLVNSLIFVTVGFFFARQISMLLLQDDDYAYLVYLSLATLAISTITMPFHSYLRMEEKARTFVIISIISTLLSLTLNVGAVVYLRRGVQGMLEASLITGVVTLGLTIISILPSLGFQLNLRWIPSLIKIGYPSIFGLGAFFLMDWADRAIIQRMIGMEELGVYSVGYSFGLLMVLFAEGSFGSAWTPYFMSFINKRDEARILFGRIFKYFLLAYGTLTLVFFIAAQPIIVLMTAKPFHSAYTVVGPVACSYMLKVCYLIMLPGLYYKKKLHIQTSIEWAGAIINIGMNLLFVPLLRKEGAAIATLLSYLSLVVLAYFIGRKFLPVEYDWKSIGRFVGIFPVLAGVSYIPLTNSAWLNSGVNGALFIVFCFVVYFIVLTSSERRMVMSLLARVQTMFSYAKA